MTLQKLTDTLQQWCHQGHAQDEVEFVVDEHIHKPDSINVFPKMSPLPKPRKTILLCIEEKADKQG